MNYLKVKINNERVNKLIKLARLALFLKMGIKESENIDIKIIPLKPVTITLKPLKFYLSNALKNRPEIKEIQYGLRAKKSLIAAEKSSFYPIFFIGGEIKYNWSPVVDDQHSPWLDDPYNGIDGGVAIGLILYAMGTGEAKDALEGLAAYALAKQKYYTAIYDFNIKVAELLKSAGMDEVTENDS